MIVLKIRHAPLKSRERRHHTLVAGASRKASPLILAANNALQSNRGPYV